MGQKASPGRTTTGAVKSRLTPYGLNMARIWGEPALKITSGTDSPVPAKQVADGNSGSNTLYGATRKSIFIRTAISIAERPLNLRFRPMGFRAEEDRPTPFEVYNWR